MSKVILICLSVAVLVAVASAGSECQAAADTYVSNYNSEHGTAYRLEEISSCSDVGDRLYMSLIMMNEEGHYVSCLDILATGSIIRKPGTCY